MRFGTRDIVIKKEEDDPGYFAYSPALPGCFSNGTTIEEARQNMRAALQQHLAVLETHACDPSGPEQAEGL